MIVGQPDGNPNQFECNFGAYQTTSAGAAGVTTSSPIPCDGTIQQKFSWDGMTFFPLDDLTPPGCGGGGRPPGSDGNGSPESGGGAAPSVKLGPGSSTKSQGATVIVDPGIRVKCPTGGPVCSAVESATARVRASKNAKVVIGQAQLVIPAGRTVTLTFKLNSRGVKLLRSERTLRVEVSVASRVAGNKLVRTTKQIAVRLPATKRGR